MTFIFNLKVLMNALINFFFNLVFIFSLQSFLNKYLEYSELHERQNIFSFQNIFLILLMQFYGKSHFKPLKFATTPLT